MTKAVVPSGPRAWLAHPLTRGLDQDDPRTTALRRRIIREKPFLKRIYEEWYASVASAIPSEPGALLELGSGAGFMEEHLPALITSDLIKCPGVEAILNGQALPFANGSLRGIVMVDVLHHISQPRRFFAEAARCVRTGGILAMHEPWVTSWSRPIYTYLHHEPFEPAASAWEFPASGPLSGANGALPWILFVRDRRQFEHEFPQWRVEEIRPNTPFRYLVSGGLSLRSLVPDGTYGIWRGLESALGPWMKHWAMFALIVLRKKP